MCLLLVFGLKIKIQKGKGSPTLKTENKSPVLQTTDSVELCGHNKS